MNPLDPLVVLAGYLTLPWGAAQLLIGIFAWLLGDLERLTGLFLSATAGLARPALLAVVTRAMVEDQTAGAPGLWWAAAAAAMIPLGLIQTQRRWRRQTDENGTSTPPTTDNAPATLGHDPSNCHRAGAPRPTLDPRADPPTDHITRGAPADADTRGDDVDHE